MSVDTDLATLRDWIGDPEDYSDEDRGAAERACDACDGVEAELSRLREQRDALRADYGDALKEVDELLDLMDAGREHIEPHDPIAPFLSAGWQCPVCDRRGNLHDERCLVLEIAAVARRRKNGNRRLVVTNGRLRARAESAEAEVRQLREDKMKLHDWGSYWKGEARRLTEGLRERHQLLLDKLDWIIGYATTAENERWGERLTEKLTEFRALLSANPPQGDAADFCEHGYTTEDSAHPSAGLERCPTCSPSDGGGA